MNPISFPGDTFKAQVRGGNPLNAAFFHFFLFGKSLRQHLPLLCKIVDMSSHQEREKCPSGQEDGQRWAANIPGRQVNNVAKPSPLRKTGPTLSHTKKIGGIISP